MSIFKTIKLILIVKTITSIRTKIIPTYFDSERLFSGNEFQIIIVVLLDYIAKQNQNLV